MDEFWVSWDEVVAEIRASGKTEMANALQETRNCLNGLTEGWFEFLKESEQIIESNSTILSKCQIDQLSSVLGTVRESLGVKKK